MTVYVDADACPVVRQIEEIAKEFSLPVVLLCDTNHILSSNYSEIVIVGAGADAVDFALVNRCKSGDIVVTQDYGVAAMVLSKGAKAIHQSGSIYTDQNISLLLESRYIAGKIRRSSSKCHIKGPKKRTHEDDMHFVTAFKRLCRENL